MKRLLGAIAVVALLAALGWYLHSASERDALETAAASAKASMPAPGSSKVLAPEASGPRDGLENTRAPEKAPLFPPNAQRRRAHATEHPVVPEGPAKDHIADLQTQATGSPPSAQAAFLLYHLLNACRGVAGWSAQELAIEKARRGADPKLQLPDCNGVSKEDFAQADRWLKIAADLGSEGAQVQYAQRYFQNFDDLQKVLKNPQQAVAYREEAARYLVSASSGGNWDAMWNLSRSYEEGTLTERNPQLAYAYRYAIQRTGGLPITIGNAVSVLQKQMTAEEVQAAQRLGDQIVANCCLQDK